MCVSCCIRASLGVANGCVAVACCMLGVSLVLWVSLAVYWACLSVFSVCLCVRVCVRACVRACVRVCMYVCVCV